jgi:hypothetical protein
MHPKSEHPKAIEMGITARKCSDEIVQHTRNDTATSHTGSNQVMIVMRFRQHIQSDGKGKVARK